MSKDIANQLFLAYMGRPADAGWRTATANLLNNAAPPVALQNAFFSAAVLEGVYSLNDSSATLVNKIFLNIFGFAARTDEQVAWGNLISNGTITAQTAAWTIFSSYLGATNVPDVYKTPTQSKLVALDAYVTELGNNSAANIAVSQLGSTGATAARTFLSGVTSTATAATAITGIAATVSGVSSSTTGSTFNLSTGIDLLTGTSSNDTFIGSDGTFTTGDRLVGGAGTDTLSLVFSGANTAAVDASSVEVVQLRSTQAGTTVDLSGFGDITKVVNDRSAVAITFNNVQKLATVGLSGSTTETTTVNYAASVVAGSSDAIGLELAGATIPGGKALTIAGVETFNAVTSGGATSIDTFTAAAGKTLNVTGTADLTITTALANTFTTVNGTGLTGKLTVGVAAGANLTFTGGSGNDKLAMALGLDTNDVIDGGAGTDTLTITHAATTGSVIPGGTLKVSNVEIVGLGATLTTSGNANFDVSKFGTSANGFIVDAALTNGGGFDFTVNNLASGASIVLNAGYTGANGDDLVLSFPNAGAAGSNADSVNFSVAGGVTFGTVAAGDIKIDNVETINIATTGSAGNAALSFADTGVKSVVVTGARQLTTDFTGSSITSIDASAATGAYIQGAGAGTSGLSAAGAVIKGGSAGDTLRGAAGQDQIDGGAGGDTINAGAGGDLLTGGAGSDIFQFAVGDSTLAALDRITDLTFGAGGDQISGAATIVFTATTTATQTAINAAASLAAAVDAALANDDANAANAQVFTYSSKTYVLYEGTAAGNTFNAAQDFIVEVTGVTGTAVAANFV